MIAALIAMALACALGVAAWRVDQHVLCCASPWRARLATAVLIAASWVCFFVLMLTHLGAPVGHGPTELWSTETTRRLLGLCLLALLTLLLALPTAGATLIATAVSMFAPSSTPRWWRFLLPALAFVTFILAVSWISSYGLLPSV